MALPAALRTRSLHGPGRRSNNLVLPARQKTERSRAALEPRRESAHRVDGSAEARYRPIAETSTEYGDDHSPNRPGTVGTDALTSDRSACFAWLAR